MVKGSNIVLWRNELNEWEIALKSELRGKGCFTTS